LAFVHAGWLLVAVRLLNGLLALATVVIVSRTLKGRARTVNGLIAVGALICSESFLLAGSLARNDALPMALLAAGLAALLSALERDDQPSLFALAGCLFGLAASAKINAAVPAAGAAMFILFKTRTFGPRSAFLFFGGGILGLLPCLLFAAVAPTQFRFDVFTYGVDAPVQWWTSVGKLNLLSWRGIPDLVGLASRGIVLIGLVAAAADRRRRDDLHLLDLMIVGGVVAAYLTQPPFPQYLVPLLPPVTIRFAMALDRVHRPARSFVLTLTAFCSVLGLLDTIHYVVRIRARGLELAQAVQVGRDLAVLGHGRSVVTLSPELIAGSGTILDPRFAAGPFLFRTSDGLARQALKYGYSPTWQTISAALDSHPPGAVLVGGELRPQAPLHPTGLDAPLIAWAVSRSYKPVALGNGFTLFLRP
jgi:4-amino-4-deoxy-L-arabinose transferase-like glycosyltransferase